MILTRLSATNFMRFREPSWGAACRGLVGIVGENEAGKTTIGAARLRSGDRRRRRRRCRQRRRSAHVAHRLGRGLRRGRACSSCRPAAGSIFRRRLPGGTRPSSRISTARPGGHRHGRGPGRCVSSSATRSPTSARASTCRGAAALLRREGDPGTDRHLSGARFSPATERGSSARPSSAASDAIAQVLEGRAGRGRHRRSRADRRRGGASPRPSPRRSRPRPLRRRWRRARPGQPSRGPARQAQITSSPERLVGGAERSSAAELG
jgi:hypothetical protein